MKQAYRFAVYLLAAVIALSAPAALADSSNKIAYRNKITLKVGQAAVIHGRRGPCGQLPSKADLAKSKADIEAQLSTGRISFGKPGVRQSGGCGGLTPAYETIFIAERKGRETIKVHGDPVRITVK